MLLRAVLLNRVYSAAKKMLKCSANSCSIFNQINHACIIINKIKINVII